MRIASPPLALNGPRRLGRRARPAPFLLGITLVLLLVPSAPASARAGWKIRIDHLVRGRSVGVSLSNDGHSFYSHRRHDLHAPASNEKLILSMALLDKLPRETKIETSAAVSSSAAGIVPGDLWILGHGDPTITGGGRYAHDLASLGATHLGVLARKIKAGGIKRIQGSVVGSTGYFTRDWWAPGWKRDFPAEEVALPSALTFNGNTHRGRHISDPEKRAATWLTHKLRSLGVRVDGPARAGRPPAPKERKIVATIRSVTLPKLLRYMNRNSSNFFAELLGKRLAVETYDGWGSIPKAAAAIERFAKAHHVTVSSYDSSGLSYDGRVSAGGLTRLLTYAEKTDWGAVLKSTLAAGGEGTLEDRLEDVRIRAKTGTLDNISALSGWIWLQRSRSWGEFSILSNGMPKYRAAALEDKIVRIATRRAGPLTHARTAARPGTHPVRTSLAPWGWLQRLLA
jgi:D-alanyl-D-alanine carboxypeptidase